MDIRSYFGSSTSSKSSVAISSFSARDSSSSDSDTGEPPAKKAHREKFRPLNTTRKYSKSWEKQFSWLEYDVDIDGAFCRVCKQTTSDSSTQHTGGVWVTKPFRNWKKAVQKMKAHEASALHSQASQALLLTSTKGSVMHQLQTVGRAQREKNRVAMKSLVHCAHFLTRHHIAHSTNFTNLVDLVVSCGARELQVFFRHCLKKCSIYISWGSGRFHRSTCNMGRRISFEESPKSIAF